MSSRSDLSEQDLQRAFAALRKTDRRHMPSFAVICPDGAAGVPAEGPSPPQATEAAWEALLEAPVGEHGSALAAAERLLGTRPLAERLVEASTERVRNHPNQAAELARLARRCLAAKSEPADDGPWRASLSVRADAYEANAFRVQGDLRQARRIFQALDGDERLRHLDLVERAELARLEASLFAAERDEAGALRKMEEAEALHREAGDSRGVATCLIKRANLAIHHLRTEESLELLEQASALLDPEADATLHLSTVIGRINAHCDLDQPQEARALLASHWSEIVNGGDRHVMTLGQNLRGRIALEQSRFADAERDLRRAVEMNLEIGRHLDAALACHSLAEALLALGKVDELREMARDALELFQVQGVTRDALAALRLLAKAAQAETISRSALVRLRRNLQART